MQITIPKAHLQLTTSECHLVVDKTDRAKLEDFMRQHNRRELRVDLSLSDDELDKQIASMRNEKAQSENDLRHLSSRLCDYENLARERKGEDGSARQRKDGWPVGDK